MAHLAGPLFFAVLFWWISTGAILWLVSRPRTTFKWTALGATAMLGAATVALLALRDAVSVPAAYGGFAVGVLLWAWHEVMFLLGYVAGPRKTPCPPGLRAWPRFLASAETVIYHELAIAIHAVIILLLSWGAANQLAAITFFLLWGMRITAKLVVFSGAPNISIGFIPEHLRYLATYFSRRRGGLFLPAALTVVVSAAAAIIYQATQAPLGSFHSAGWILVGALAALAVIEHLALVLPVPDAVLWEWAVPRNSSYKQADLQKADQ